jgi:hypothetical protein
MDFSNDQKRERLKQIYDSYRKALMNQKYYRYEIDRLQKLNTAFEFVIAGGTGGSGVSAWPLWQSDVGIIIWGTITAVAATAAIAKPILQISKIIEDYSNRYSKYSVIVEESERLVQDIRFKHDFEPAHDAVFQHIPKLFGEVVRLEKENPRKKLLRKCFDEVNERYPPESFWMPASEPTELTKKET